MQPVVNPDGAGGKARQVAVPANATDRDLEAGLDDLPLVGHVLRQV